MAPATGSTSRAVTAKATNTTQSVIPFAITTTYTAPSQCAQSIGGLTMVENDQYRVWLNAILPVPGTTVTACYPTQYISSFLLQTGGVSQAPISPLVCPSGYTTQVPFTSNYIACCPSGWDGLALASEAPSDRPAFGGTCYTNIYNVLLSVSFYDNSALKATSIFKATASTAQALAYPYEGFALGVAVVPSTPGTGSSSQPISTSTSSSATSATAAVVQSHHLTGGAIAGTAIGVLIGIALLVAASFLILKYRRSHFANTKKHEQEFQYGSSPPNHDPNAPMAGYYNSDPKKDFPPPEELYGSQDIKNHGETQELDSGRHVFELGDGQVMPAHEMGWTMSERDKSLPSLPSPLSSPLSANSDPVSPQCR